ncbi:MAG: ATP-binding protein [Burkholderia gladioli]
MNVRRPESSKALFEWLAERRGLLARRWLRALRQDPLLERIAEVATPHLFSAIDPVLTDVIAMLKSGAEPTSSEAQREHVRNYASSRWRPGYRFDDLYRELNLFERCLHVMVREYFARDGAARDQQPAAHRAIEDFFSAVTHDTIQQFVEEQQLHLSAANQASEDAAFALARVEERLRMAASAASLGIFEWHVPTKRGIWENDLMYRITGQPKTSGPLSCHAFVRQLAHPEDADGLLNRYLHAMRHDNEFHSRFRVHRIDDGALRFVEMHGRFRRDRAGEIDSFVGTLEDVTRSVLAEHALQDADRKKDAFLATLAHELRNPLAPIRTAAALIRSGANSEASLDVAAVIERQCAHLARLIDDLLDVSRIGTGKIRLDRRPYDLRESIQCAMEINEPKARERGHTIDRDIPDCPLVVDGDATRLTQVFSNLLDNALKYSDDGTRVMLSVSVMEHAVVVTVKDAGIGIAPELLASLFERYVQLAPADARARSGLGIGLSVVRNLVEMHDGSVVANSEGVGKGATFTVTLPTTTVAPAPPATGPAVAWDEAALSSRRILLVDDNVDALAAMAALLADHEVRTAASGEEAIGVAARFDADFAILDIDLPDMSGFELARELRKMPGMQSTRFIALSGFGAEEDVSHSREEGFSCHFIKPVDPNALFSALKHHPADSGDAFPE